MNEHKNIITIEDEIKEFSDKPVKSSVLYKKVKELESNAVPDSSEASVGDVLTKGEDGIGWSAPSGGGGVLMVTEDENGVLNKTWQEIHDAMAAGQIPVVGYSDRDAAGITIFGWGAHVDGAYSLWGHGANLSQDDPLYSASSASGYPTLN